MSKCRSCGHALKWAETENGKKIPLDVPSEGRFVIGEDGVARVEETYKSHFSTCPDSNEWRKS